MRSILLYIIPAISLLFSSCSTKEQKSIPISDSNVQQNEILPSWNEGETKQALIEFITNTTKKNSPGYIPIEDRIATFDNDGNLWSEQPLYFQLFYVVDRVNELADSHPEWKNEEPFKSILEGSIENALAGGNEAILKLVAATHGNISTEEYNQSVVSWLKTKTHPKTGLHFNEMVYQPMIELIQLLQSKNYKVFIVSGGGIDFMRVWASEAYGIPSEHIIGSSVNVKYELIEGRPYLMKQPTINFIDDKEGKPVGIHQHIGKKPVFASGNSDGDYQMLEWTTTDNQHPSLGLYLHHTDSIREWAYDKDSHIGKLDKGLDDAKKKGWIVIDMAKDWNTIYPEKN